MGYSYLFKYIMIGDQSVGKSCILMNFIDRKFILQSTPTVGVQFGSKIIKLKKQIIKLQIWDTAGQQTFRSITKSYYRGTIGSILVYDITSRKSFLNIKNWLEQTRNFATTEKICIILVGNKIDMNHNRQVSYDEGSDFAKANGLIFVECSAKSGQNIDQIFELLSETVLEKIGRAEIDLNDENGGVRLGNCSPLNQQKGTNCC